MGTSTMRPAHVRAFKQTAVERKYNEDNLLAIENFFKKLFRCFKSKTN
jgi:hypothetical protein